VACDSFTTNNPRTLAELAAWQAGPTEPVLEPGLPIVDPHHHLREGAAGRYHLPELGDDLARGHDERATVFVDSQTRYRGDGPPLLQPVGETEWVVRHLAEAGPAGPGGPCTAIVGHLDLTNGAAVREGLLAHIAAGAGRFRGIRDPLVWDAGDFAYGPRRPAPDRMSDPRFLAGFAELAPLDMSFDAWLFHPQIPRLTELARRFPGTRIVLDHVGAPLGVGPYAGRRAEVFAAWRSAIVELARCDNVVVKLGGLGMMFFGFGFEQREPPVSSETLAAAWRPYVETCIEAFGPPRCMFESNFPVDKQTCGWTALWNAFKRIVASHSDAEKLRLFFGTANEVYRLGLDPTSPRRGDASPRDEVSRRRGA
jgi:predicted TIM-barrel fold metal-dependent hydrolase